MDFQKEYKKITQGVTTSSLKKSVLNTRIEAFVIKLKKSWYKKLFNKLELIKKGELNLDDYVNEINNKVK